MVYNYFPNKAALVTYSEQYVCAEGGGGQALVANRETPAAWETFDLELIDPSRWVHNGFRNNSQIALKASNGMYVCADGNQNWWLYANRTARGLWETFFIEDMDDYTEIHSGSKITLKAYNGKYVCAENGGGNGLIANRTARGPWETFVLELLWNIRPRPVLYEHRDYQGRQQGMHPGLYPGLYDHPLRIGNDLVSSLKVPQGCRVVLYEHEHSAGRSKLCLSDISMLSDFNDLTSSVRVGNLLVGSNYTDLGCNLAGRLDYYPGAGWETELRRNVQRGLDKLRQYGVKQVRVWVVPPSVGLHTVEGTFMPARIRVIAQEARSRGMIVTVDLHDFNMEPNVSPDAGCDQLLRDRINAIVIPNSSFSNLRWSIGNEIRC